MSTQGAPARQCQDPSSPNDSEECLTAQNKWPIDLSIQAGHVSLKLGILGTLHSGLIFVLCPWDPK